MSGKGTALVTGAAHRIGKAIAERLAIDGWTVAIHYNGSRDGAEETAASIRSNGGAAFTVQADLSDMSSLEAMVDDLWQGHGGVTCLVNNASTFAYDTALDWTESSWAHHFDVNLRAPLFLARELAGRLREGESGSVVNLLDQKVYNLNPDFFTYTMSKLALEASTRLLAQALAPKVRVNGVAPGLTLPSGDQTVEEFRSVHSLTALGRGTGVEDVASAVAWLAGADAVTGDVITVACGQHLVPSRRDVMFLDREGRER